MLKRSYPWCMRTAPKDASDYRSDEFLDLTTARPCAKGGGIETRALLTIIAVLATTATATAAEQMIGLQYVEGYSISIDIPDGYTWETKVAGVSYECVGPSLIIKKYKATGEYIETTDSPGVHRFSIALPTAFGEIQGDNVREQLPGKLGGGAGYEEGYTEIDGRPAYYRFAQSRDSVMESNGFGVIIAFEEFSQKWGPPLDYLPRTTPYIVLSGTSGDVPSPRTFGDEVWYYMVGEATSAEKNRENLRHVFESIRISVPSAFRITVSAEHGSVQRVLYDGTEAPLTIGEITETTKIVTHGNSYVEYWIEKYARITQGEKTLFEYKETKVTEGNLLSLLHQGIIHGFIAAGSGQIDFYFKTPAALAYVSGTEFVLEAGEDSSTALTVLGGQAELSDLNRTKIVLVSTNQKSIVKPGGLPSDPATVDPGQIHKWWEASGEVPDPYIAAVLILTFVWIPSGARR